MELTKEQAESRLRSPNNLANKLEAFRNQRKVKNDLFDSGDETFSVTHVSPGRQLPRLPLEAKKEIVTRANSGTERQSDIAKHFGVTQAAVSYLKREATDSQDAAKTNAELEREASVRSLAIDKMMLAMGLITEEKLERMNAEKLAYTANQLATVHKCASDQQSKPLVNLVVYAPEVRSEESFKIIEISGNGS